MARTVLLYALALALAVAALEWLEYRYVTRAFSTEIYVALLAAGFIGLGVWVGRRLTSRPAPAAFERNQAAIRSRPDPARMLDPRALATGISQEMARGMAISPTRSRSLSRVS